jgi:transcriptional regulator with XRE-family HTH domain
LRRRKFKLNSAITDRVLSIIKARGISNYRLSKDAGIHEASLSGYSRNLNDWNIETLTKIAQYFRVSLDWLINGEAKNSEVQESGQTYPEYTRLKLTVKKQIERIEELEDENKRLRQALLIMLGEDKKDIKIGFRRNLIKGEQINEKSIAKTTEGKRKT